MVYSPDMPLAVKLPVLSSPFLELLQAQSARKPHFFVQI
jgi:hypothetical protein